MASSDKSYFKQDPRRKFSPKKYEKIFQDTQREVHKQWAIRMAAGFSKIVADWDSKVKPSFKSNHRYMTATNRVFTYVYMNGSEDAKMIFRMLDFGATRGQTVTAGPGTEPTSEDSVGKKAIYVPRATYGPAPIGSYVSAKDKERRRIKSEEDKLIKASSKRKKKTKKKPPKPGRTRPGSRLKTWPYTARTSKSGSFGGAGYSASVKKPERGHGQPKKMKLKPISARRWSWRLRTLIQGKNFPYAQAIWGINMSQDYVVRKGYRDAKKVIKAAGG